MVPEENLNRGVPLTYFGLTVARSRRFNFKEMQALF